MNRFLFAPLLVVLPTAAFAADDRAAGLFAEATQLPLESQALFVEVGTGEATVRLVQVFANEGPALAQADLILPLPEEASVLGFGFYQGERFFEAELKEKAEAEAAHREAAEAGRTTGLLVAEGRVQRFSVYPLPAGGKIRTEARLRIPVVSELGRRHLALPVRTFLGRAAVRSTVVVSLPRESEIEDLRIDDAQPLPVFDTKGRMLAAFSTSRETEVSWREPGPPLALSASIVELPEGGLAVETRIAFNMAPSKARPIPEARHVLVDVSHSMRRRQRAVSLVLARLRKLSPEGTLHVHYLAESRQSIDELESLDRMPELGFELNPKLLERTIAALRCGSADNRCYYMGDLSGESLAALAEKEIPMLLVADAYEESFFRTKRPRDAALHLEGVDPDAKLLAAVDELVLPVLAVVGQAATTGRYEVMGRGSRRVAEGGFLRLHGRVERPTEIELEYTLDESSFQAQLRPEALSPDSPEGQRVRRAYYEKHLETELERYQTAPSAELERSIIALSLREKIPTPFTALQVDAPKTSLFDIKPGDPLLTVADEPGLQEVVAYFPFGESMRLVRSDDGRFLGRFLVPRGHADRTYAIEIVKHFEDGRTKWERAFYRIDSQAPSFTLRVDEKSATLLVETGADTPHIGAVWAELADGRTERFTRQDGRFVFPAAALGPRFRVQVRDRAGNLSSLAAHLEPGLRLRIEAEPLPTPLAPSLDLSAVPLRLELKGPGPMDLQMEGDELLVSLGGERRRLPYDPRVIRSLRVRHLLEQDENVYTLATEAGDLVVIECRPGARSCRADRRADFGPNPIVGLARAKDGATLIAVRGRGLFELRGTKLRRSPTPLPTSQVTGLVKRGDTYYLGTKGHGLLVQRRGRWQASRLMARQVFGLEMRGDETVVFTDAGPHRIVGRDRFKPSPILPTHSEDESPSLTTSAELGGRLFVGGFDGGLFVLESGVLLRVPLQGSITQRHVNRLLAVEGALLIATEAGLFEVRSSSDGDLRARTLLEGPVHDLAAEGTKLAVAASTGLFVGSMERLERWDSDLGARGARYSAVAWHEGNLFAGGLDGLHRWEGPGRFLAVSNEAGHGRSWVTALASTTHGLYVGTYDEGVALWREGALRPLPELERQWVPFGALRQIEDSVYIGGLGMNPARRFADGRVEYLAVPSRDTNDFVSHEGRTYLLTRDGLARTGDEAPLAWARPRGEPASTAR